MNRHYISISSKIFLLISLAVFLNTSVGHCDLIKFNLRSQPNLTEQFEDITVYSMNQVLKHADLKIPLKEGQEQNAMIRIFKVTTKKFRHGLANHTVFTNWLIWAAGLLNKNWLEITDTNTLLKYSDHALCHQSAQTLVDLAGLLGLKARIVNLNGHTLMEAYYNNNYHMFDPDYEIIPQKGEEVLSVQQLIDWPNLIEKFYANNPHTP